MSAQFASTTRRLRPASATWLALALAWPAQAQGVTPALETLRGDLEVLLSDRNPSIRGEAALALAATGDSKYHSAIREITRDRSRAARLKGIVALGVLGSPGAETVLGELLLAPGPPSPDRDAAALSLGLLPDSFPVPAIERYFNRVDGGSYRKNHDTLSSMLVGLSLAPHPSRVPTLARLLDDAANRDPRLRRLAMLALAANPDALPQIETAEWLGSKHEDERLGALEAIEATGEDPGQEAIKLIGRTARRDRSPRVRAAALRVLTRLRHPDSLELSVVAIGSRHVEEVAAGVDTARRLGGGTIRMAMEDQILHAKRADLQAAMLAEYDASANPEFVTGCLRLAEDRRTAEAVRVQAASLAARSGERKSGGTIRELFAQAKDVANLRALAAAAHTLDPSLISLDRVFPPTSGDDLRLLAARTEALLAARHPGAPGLLKEALGSELLQTGTRAQLLRALRRVALGHLDAEVSRALPKALGAAIE